MDKTISSKIDLIDNYCKSKGAEQFEVMLYDNLAFDISTRLKKIEQLEQNKSRAFGLRVLIGKKQAFTSSSDLSEFAIKASIDRAVDMAKTSPEDQYIDLPDDELFVHEIPDLELSSKVIPSEKQLMEDALEMEEVALAMSGISNSHGASSNYSSSNIYFANSKGINLSCSSSTFSKSIACIAASENGMEYDYDYSISRRYDNLKENREIAIKAAERALARLNPRKIDSTQVAVIFTPRIASKFIANFAGLSNGQNFVLGTSFLKDYLGKKIFPENISIIDDPHIKGGLGSCPFDSEAVKNQKTHIVKDGIFEVCMLDCYHARKLGRKTTGHAKRGLSSPTHPGSTNFYLDNGSHSFKDLLGFEEKVIVIDNVFSSNLNSLNGDISQGFAGFYYERGQLQYPVSEVSYAGNLLDFYQKMIPANDLRFDSSINSPSIFIPSITIAGK